MITSLYGYRLGNYILKTSATLACSHAYLNAGPEVVSAMAVRAILQGIFVSLEVQRPDICCETNACGDHCAVLSGADEANKPDDADASEEVSTIKVTDDGYRVEFGDVTLEVDEPAEIAYEFGRPVVTVKLTADKVVLE